jgi:hypothetical protein
MSIELWLWEIRDPQSGRWRKTTYRMTDDDARECFGADARKINWTREVRIVDPQANSTGSFLRARPVP